MKEKSNDRVSLYKLISKDKKVVRFRDFHSLEAETILTFLMQIGYSKAKMINAFNRMLYLNERICINKTYMSYMESDKVNNVYVINFKSEDIDKQMEEYEKLKKSLLRYIKNIDLTDNQEIVIAFKSLIMYERHLQKLYERIAKDRERIFALLDE